MRGHSHYPSGWTAQRLKYVATYNDETLPESTDDLKEINYVEISGVTLSGGIEETNRISFFQAPSRARRKVRSGDILISTVRTYLKAIAAVDEASDDLVASTGFCVVRPRDEVDSSYLGWVAKSEPFVSEVVARSVGVSYPAINASELATIEVPLPPLDVQRRIARFLDEKTARIDALIEKKRELLDRLAEKRQALITRAVTQGLDPDVPRKPSGIDWLGDVHAWAAGVPEGWQRNWLKWSVHLSTERPTDEEKEQLPYISNEDIESWTGRLLNKEPKPSDADSRKFKTDDVLLNKLRPYLAKVYHAEFNGVNSGELLCLRSSRRVLPRFLFYVLASKVFIDAIDAETFGSKMPRADWKIVGHQPLPLPPLPIQRRIAQSLDEKTTQIDDLNVKINNSIEVLAEYRAALITAAVTGQIEGLR